MGAMGDSRSEQYGYTDQQLTYSGREALQLSLSFWMERY